MESVLPATHAPPGSSPVEESKEARKERRRREKERIKEEETKAAAHEQTLAHNNVQPQTQQPASAASEQFLAAIGQSMLQTLFQSLVHHGPPAHTTYPNPQQQHHHSTHTLASNRLSARHLTEAPTSNTAATPIRKSSAAVKLESVSPSIFPATAEVGVLRDQLAVKSFLLAQEERRTAALLAEKEAVAKELATLKEEMEGKIKKARKAVKEAEEASKKPVLVLATCAPSHMPGVLKGLSTQELRVIKTQLKAGLAAASKAKKDAKRREAASARHANGGPLAAWIPSSLLSRPPTRLGPIIATPLISSSQRSLVGAPPSSPIHSAGVNSQLGGMMS